MKPAHLSIITAFLVLSVFPPDSVSARNMARPKPTPVPVKVDASGAKITAVTADSVKIEHSKTTQTYKISSGTRITIDGQKASAGDLKPGMHVEVDADKIKPDVLLSISATSAVHK